MKATLLNAQTTTGAGINHGFLSNVKTFQGIISNTTTPTATVLIEGSLDGVNWSTITTLSFTSAGQVLSHTSTDAWATIRGNVTAISGASASVTLLGASL